MARPDIAATRTTTPLGLTGISRAPIPRLQTTAVPESLHQHTEVELIVCTHGALTMLFSGRQLDIPAGRLTLFWGAMPHQALRSEVQTEAHVLRLPMPLIMQWNLPAWLIRQLVDFQVVQATPHQFPCPDAELVKDWIRLLGRKEPEAERIVMLEVEARLRRMARESGAAQALAPRTFGAGRLERLMEIIAQRCLGRLRIPEIAREAGLTRTYAMRLFRKHIGMTMLEYITRQRISHAQRLLASTDRRILDVMEACGFTSTTRFYAVFRKIAGCKPGDYRQRFQCGRPPRPRAGKAKKA